MSMLSIGDTIAQLISEYTRLNATLSTIIVTAAMIVVWIFLGLIISKIVTIIIFRALKVNKNPARAETIAKLLSSISKYVIWFIIFMVILGEIDVDITPFIASAGVIGLAIGFGSQEIVRDFISGFFIIFDGEFNVGDVIESDGFKGTVKTIGLRTTVIENWKGETKIINNGNLGNIINNSTNKSLAIVNFGVAYDTDLHKLYEIMPNLLDKIEASYETIVEKPVFSGITELADSSINMRIVAKTNTMEHFQVERDIRRDIVVYFSENDIEIPFPQLVVHNGKD
ncbi:MAG: mechanosensitive ion channel family protein [Candidatus Izimaplasma sp.]|nr:mechanosensitive ion channel family protein [Candidatus Izimaplasma bacterium]